MRRWAESALSWWRAWCRKYATNTSYRRPAAAPRGATSAPRMPARAASKRARFLTSPLTTSASAPPPAAAAFSCPIPQALLAAVVVVSLASIGMCVAVSSIVIFLLLRLLLLRCLLPRVVCGFLNPLSPQPTPQLAQGGRRPTDLVSSIISS